MQFIKRIILMDFFFSEFALFFKLSVTGWFYFSVFTRQNRSHAKRQVSEQDFSRSAIQNRKLFVSFCPSLERQTKSKLVFLFFPFHSIVTFVCLLSARWQWRCYSPSSSCIHSCIHKYVRVYSVVAQVMFQTLMALLLCQKRMAA